MKKVFQKLMFVAAVGTIGFLYSCGEDEETLPEAPTVTASADATEYEVGETAAVTVQFTAPGELSGINITPEFDGQQGTTDFNSPSDFGLTDTETAGTVTINFEIDETLADLTVKLLIDVVDKNNQIATDSVEFTVATADPIARSYTAILLSAPLQDAEGTTGSKTSLTFFSTNTGERYSMAQVNQSSDPLSADIDFGYFFGSGNAGTGATLSDPASYPFAYGQAAWGTRNNTVFRRTALTSSSFTEVVTFTDIDAAFEAAVSPDSDAGIESGLVEGEVLAFETDASKTGGAKRGLILVNSITPGDGENGQISLEILVQEEATN